MNLNLSLILVKLLIGAGFLAQMRKLQLIHSLEEELLPWQHYCSSYRFTCYFNVSSRQRFLHDFQYWDVPDEIGFLCQKNFSIFHLLLFVRRVVKCFFEADSEHLDVLLDTSSLWKTKIMGRTWRSYFNFWNILSGSVHCNTFPRFFFIRGFGRVSNPRFATPITDSEEIEERSQVSERKQRKPETHSSDSDSVLLVSTQRKQQLAI